MAPLTRSKKAALPKIVKPVERVSCSNLVMKTIFIYAGCNMLTLSICKSISDELKKEYPCLAVRRVSSCGMLSMTRSVCDWLFITTNISEEKLLMLSAERAPLPVFSKMLVDWGGEKTTVLTNVLIGRAAKAETTATRIGVWKTVKKLSLPPTRYALHDAAENGMLDTLKTPSFKNIWDGDMYCAAARKNVVAVLQLMDTDGEWVRDGSYFSASTMHEAALHEAVSYKASKAVVYLVSKVDMGFSGVSNIRYLCENQYAEMATPLLWGVIEGLDIFANYHTALDLCDLVGGYGSMPLLHALVASPFHSVFPMDCDAHIISGSIWSDNVEIFMDRMNHVTFELVSKVFPERRGCTLTLGGMSVAGVRVLKHARETGWLVVDEEMIHKSRMDIYGKLGQYLLAERLITQQFLDEVEIQWGEMNDTAYMNNGVQDAWMDVEEEGP